MNRNFTIRVDGAACYKQIIFYVYYIHRLRLKCIDIDYAPYTRTIYALVRAATSPLFLGGDA